MQIPINLQNLNLNEWSIEDVSNWLILNSIPIDKVNIIKEQEIDGAALRELDKPALKEIGISPLGPVLKIYSLIRELIEVCSREPAVRDNLSSSVDSPMPITEQSSLPPLSAQLPQPQSIFSLTANNSTGISPTTQHNSNQNSQLLKTNNTLNNNVSSPSTSIPNNNTQQILSQYQFLNDSNRRDQNSESHISISPSSYNTNIKAEPIDQALSSATQVKQEKISLEHSLNNPNIQQSSQVEDSIISSQADINNYSDLNLLSLDVQQKEVSSLIETFKLAWKDKLSPSLKKNSNEIYQYCKDKKSKVKNSIDQLLNNKIFPIISLFTQSSLRRLDCDLILEKLAEYIGSYRVLIWIRDLIYFPEDNLNQTILNSNLNPSLSNSNIIDSDSTYNWSESNIDRLLNLPNLHISEFDFFKKVLEECQTRTPDIELNLPQINEIITNYLEKRDLYFSFNEPSPNNQNIENEIVPSTTYRNRAEFTSALTGSSLISQSHQQNVNRSPPGIEDLTKADESKDKGPDEHSKQESHNRHLSEMRNSSTQRQSDYNCHSNNYTTRTPVNREVSPEPHSDSYSSSVRSRHPSESQEYSRSRESSRSGSRHQPIERQEHSRHDNQRRPNMSRRPSNYSDRNRSSSYRDRSTDLYNDSGYNRNNEYIRSVSRSSDYSQDSRLSASSYDYKQNRNNRSYKNCRNESDRTPNQSHLSTIQSQELLQLSSAKNINYRPSFLFKEISKTKKSSLPKPSITLNKYKHSSNPTLDPPRRDIQILPPFSNFKNSSISIKTLALNLQPHQISGVEFLWKTIVENGHGGILAHAMGLGKTGQIYAFLNTLKYYIRFHSSIIPNNLLPFKVLILTPASLQENWMNEFQKWTNFETSLKKQSVHIPIPISLGESPPQQRIHRVTDWTNNGGIVIISHSLFRNCIHSSDVYEQQFEGLLLNQPGASLVVIDEAHVLKEEDSIIRSIAKKFSTPSRIMLTGYPIQNRLTEYWCMSKFVKDNIFGSLQDFNTCYQNPIIRGLYAPSSSILKKESDKKLYKLSKLIQSIVHRVNSDVIKDQIPTKIEYAVCCYLSPIQYERYKIYIELFLSKLIEIQFLEKGNLLHTICNMPIHKELIIKSNNEDNNDQISNSTRSQGSKHIQNLLAEIENLSITTTNIKNNPKFFILTELIQEFLLVDEKIIIFARQIKSLLAIQKWLLLFTNLKILLLTGETLMDDRQSYINRINEDDDYRILLASVQVGGVGFTVTGATRVIIYDVGFNPSVDDQAIARTFRIGQTKNIHVYRLFTYDTWESRLISLNDHKHTLILRTLDSRNSDFDSVDLKEMKKYFKLPNYRIEGERTLYSEDPLLQKVLNKHGDYVASCTIHREEPTEHSYEISEAEKQDIEREVAIERRKIFQK